MSPAGFRGKLPTLQPNGDDACPMTTLYWHFLDRHEDCLMKTPRTLLMARNIGRLDATQRETLRTRAAYVLANLDDL